MDDKTLVERIREQHEQKSAALRNLYGLPVIVTESDTQKGRSALWMDNGMAGCGQVAISTGEFPCKQTDAIGALVNIAAATDYVSIATRIEAPEERWAMIDKLRAAEGHSVTIIHDNPDFGGPNSVIHVSTSYGQDWEAYYGDTVDDCLRKAIDALEGSGND